MENVMIFVCICSVMLIILIQAVRETIKTGDHSEKQTGDYSENKSAESNQCNYYIDKYHYNDEYAKEFQMSYFELCDYLQKKYGIPSKSYFANEQCISKNRISRTSEGLCVHHKEEWRFSNLGKADIAKEHSFKYQQPEALIYCDYLEHILLHFKITIEFFQKTFNEVGISGIFFIEQDIYRWKNTSFDSLRPWEQNCLNKIKENLDFIEFLNDKLKVWGKGNHIKIRTY